MSTTAVTAPLSALERAAQKQWLRDATHVHYGLCHVCRRTEDDAGKPLLVARQPRRRVFECLPCWDGRQ